MNLTPLTDYLALRYRMSLQIFLAINFAEEGHYEKFFEYIFEYLILQDEMLLIKKHLRLSHEQLLIKLIYGLG